MAILSAMLHVVDSSGNRVQDPQSDGSYLPEVIKIGTGVVATSVTNGGICEINLTAGASYLCGIPLPAGTPNNGDTIVYNSSTNAWEFQSNLPLV